MSEITQILNAIDHGDTAASARLLPFVYEELRRLAIAKMANEFVDHTLQPTALVHEAYLRLVGNDGKKHWDSRGHFFAAAAEAMRQILVENARRKPRVRHGGEWRRVELGDPPALESDEKVLELDESLRRLASEDAIAARVVELRYFAGLGHEEIAATLGVTVHEAPGRSGRMLEPGSEMT